MTVGQIIPPVVDGMYIRFLKSEEMDRLSYEMLKYWLEHLDRIQREYAAGVNDRARDILNNHQSLNRWLTEETRDTILERVWELQFANYRIIQETCCRFCDRTYVGPLNLTRRQHADLMRELEVHYEEEHPEGWRLMQRNLHSNMLPYL